MAIRADKRKSLSKVAKTVLNNPLLTQREIAEETGLSLGNVNDKLNNLEQEGKKDDRIIGLTDEDFVIMKRIQEIKKQRLVEPEQVNNNDIDKWEQTATKRFSLFRGDATDKDGGLKNPDVVFQIINPNSEE